MALVVCPICGGDVVHHPKCTRLLPPLREASPMVKCQECGREVGVGPDLCFPTLDHPRGEEARPMARFEVGEWVHDRIEGGYGKLTDVDQWRGVYRSVDGVSRWAKREVLEPAPPPVGERLASRPAPSGAFRVWCPCLADDFNPSLWCACSPEPRPPSPNVTITNPAAPEGECNCQPGRLTHAMICPTQQPAPAAGGEESACGCGRTHGKLDKAFGCLVCWCRGQFHDEARDCHGCGKNCAQMPEVPTSTEKVATESNCSCGAMKVPGTDWCYTCNPKYPRLPLTVSGEELVERVVKEAVAKAVGVAAAKTAQQILDGEIRPDGVTEGEESPDPHWGDIYDDCAWCRNGKKGPHCSGCPFKYPGNYRTLEKFVAAVRTVWPNVRGSFKDEEDVRAETKWDDLMPVRCGWCDYEIRSRGRACPSHR